MKTKSFFTAALLVSVFSACNEQTKKSNGETKSETSMGVKMNSTNG